MIHPAIKLNTLVMANQYRRKILNGFTVLSLISISADHCDLSLVIDPDDAAILQINE